MRNYCLPVMLLVLTVVSVSPSWAAEPAFIGMQVQGLTKDIGTAIGDDSSGQGVLVRDVFLEGPANRSGIKRGDLILKFSDVDIGNVAQLVAAVGRLSAGMDVPVRLLRQGKIHDLTLKTVTWPPDWKTQTRRFAVFPKIGVTVASLTPKIRKSFAVRWGSHGIIITLVDAAKSKGLGLVRGQLIHQINQKPVWDPDQLIVMYKEAKSKGRKSLLLLIEDQKGFHFSILKVR